jgi:hypothetical protein
MIYGLVFLIMFMVPVVVLGWRIIVTKSRTPWRRVLAAGAAMVTTVGAFVVFDSIIAFDFKDWRSDIALVASISGSAYLLFWAQHHRGNRRHRTVSIIGAIIGLVPVGAAIASAILSREY